MAFVLSLLMALVLVSYGPGGSLGCDLSQNHVLIGRKNLRLLGQMRRLSPRFCLQDRKDFAFTQEMVEGGQLQEAQALSVLHEMLQQSFNLFHTKRSSAVWDTTLLEQLRTGLHQQLDHLDACLGQVTGEEDSALGRTTSDWSEEVLPGHPCLPAREGIQRLCLGNRQSGNHEILVFISQLARKVKNDGWRPELALT